MAESGGRRADNCSAPPVPHSVLCTPVLPSVICNLYGVINMSFYERLAQEAIRAEKNKWQPPPGVDGPYCAYFVSQMMIKAGWDSFIAVPGWAPYLYTLGKKVSECKIGFLVFFQKTYNSPGGTDKTHVGIIAGKKSGVWLVAHYSSSRNRVCIDPLSAWPEYQFECFHRLDAPAGSGDDPAPPVEFGQIKFFYHPAVDRIVIMGLGKEKEKIRNLLLTVRMENGSEILIDSHPFEENPYIDIKTPDERIMARVKAIEWHVKYLRDGERITDGG